MSMSFGVALASLVSAVFIPDRFHSTPSELIFGIHKAFAALGILTIISTITFRGLKYDDGDAVSLHEEAH